MHILLGSIFLVGMFLDGDLAMARDLQQAARQAETTVLSIAKAGSLTGLGIAAILYAVIGAQQLAKDIAIGAVIGIAIAFGLGPALQQFFMRTFGA